MTFQTLKGSLQTLSWSLRCNLLFPHFKPSKDRYKQLLKESKEILYHEFQTLKGSLQTLLIDCLLPQKWWFQTLKGSLQTERNWTGFNGWPPISNPQRIATNGYDEIRRLSELLISNPQRIATNTEIEPSFFELHTRFQTLKGSLQTRKSPRGNGNRYRFKPSKDRYKLILVLHISKGISVSNPQRIATNRNI